MGRSKLQNETARRNPESNAEELQTALISIKRDTLSTRSAMLQSDEVLGRLSNVCSIRPRSDGCYLVLQVKGTPAATIINSRKHLTKQHVEHVFKDLVRELERWKNSC